MRRAGSLTRSPPLPARGLPGGLTRGRAVDHPAASLPGWEQGRAQSARYLLAGEEQHPKHGEETQVDGQQQPNAGGESGTQRRADGAPGQPTWPRSQVPPPPQTCRPPAQGSRSAEKRNPRGVSQGPGRGSVPGAPDSQRGKAASINLGQTGKDHPRESWGWGGGWRGGEGSETRWEVPAGCSRGRGSKQGHLGGRPECETETPKCPPTGLPRSGEGSPRPALPAHLTPQPTWPSLAATT